MRFTLAQVVVVAFFAFLAGAEAMFLAHVWLSDRQRDSSPALSGEPFQGHSAARVQQRNAPSGVAGGHFNQHVRK